MFLFFHQCAYVESYNSSVIKFPASGAYFHFRNLHVAGVLQVDRTDRSGQLDPVKLFKYE